MGSVIGSCAGACCATCGCTAVDGCCKELKGSRVPYLILMMLSTMLGIVLRFWGKPLLINLTVTSITLCESERCLGYGAVYRIALALATFFLFHAGVTYATKSRKLDEGFWMAKLLVFLCMLVGVFFIPNDFYSTFAHIARFMSAMFLLLQCVLLVDAVYTWHEKWWSDDAENKWGILAVCFLGYGGSLAALICLFVYYHHATAHVLTSLTLVGSLLYTFISLGPKSDHGLMPAAVVTLYVYYLCYSAISSNAEWSDEDPNDSSIARIAIGMLLGLFSIVYSSYSASSNASQLFDEATEEEKEAERARIAAENAGKDGAELREALDASPSSSRAGSATSDREAQRDDDNGDADYNDDGSPKQPRRVLSIAAVAQYHLVMCIAAFHMSMILTDFGHTNPSAAEASSGKNQTYRLGGATTGWVVITTQWVTMALFTWTLIAPYVCASRFGNDDDDE